MRNTLQGHLLAFLLANIIIIALFSNIIKLNIIINFIIIIICDHRVSFGDHDHEDLWVYSIGAHMLMAIIYWISTCYCLLRGLAWLGHVDLESPPNLNQEEVN